MAISSVKMFAGAVLVFVTCSLSAFATPVSQPAYPTNQYYAVPQQYLQQQQQTQPRYISAPPNPQAHAPVVYEGAQQHQVSQQFAPSPPTQRVSQLLLPSAADRQVQKAAEQIAGPEYAQQVQIVQQQGLAEQALVTAQRRAQAQLRRAQQQASQNQQQVYQPQPQAQQQQAYHSQPQQQYVEIAPKQQYIRIQVPQHIAEQAQQYQLQYEPVYPQPVQPKSQRAAAQQQPQYAQNQVQSTKEEEPEEPEHDVNSSYQFGFDVKDDLYTNYQNRKEQREGGKISGSYSVVDSDGFIRTVTYTADPKEGFKAEVVRKPTDIVVKIPQPKEQPRPQPQQQPQEPHQQYIQEVSPQRYQQQPQHQQQQQQQQQQVQQKPNIVYQYQ